MKELSFHYKFFFKFSTSPLRPSDGGRGGVPRGFLWAPRPLHPPWGGGQFGGGGAGRDLLPHQILVQCSGGRNLAGPQRCYGQDVVSSDVMDRM